jgi:hypothetical protein
LPPVAPEFKTCSFSTLTYGKAALRKALQTLNLNLCGRTQPYPAFFFKISCVPAKIHSNIKQKGAANGQTPMTPGAVWLKYINSNGNTGT